MKRFVLFWCAAMLVLLAFGVRQQAVRAQTAGGFVAPGPGSAPDPCNYAPHRSAVISLTSATTQELIPGIAGREISICHINASIGSSSTLAFYQGTVGATTGLTQMSGAETALLAQNANATLMRANAGNSVFVVTTGTNGQKGWVTYVYENQQPPLVPTPTAWAAASPTPT